MHHLIDLDSFLAPNFSIQIVDSFSSDGLPSEWPVKLTMPIPFVSCCSHETLHDGMHALQLDACAFFV